MRIRPRYPIIAAHNREAAMNGKSRGVALTILAMLFAVLGLLDFLKPFHLQSNEAFVFLGVKRFGVRGAILATLFGGYLWVFSAGIWRMRKFALAMGAIYVVWVAINMTMFAMYESAAGRSHSLIEGLVNLVVGIGVPLCTTILLLRRRSELA